MGGVSMEWKEVDICQLCDSVSETYKGNASEVVLINTSDVLDGKCLNHEYVPNKKLKGQFKKTFRKGDILYSEIRPANKRFCFVDFEPKDYIASTKLMVLRAHEDVDPQYLYQILRSNDTLAQLQMLAESRSGTFPQITYSELSNIMVSLPSQKAQKNIVSILSSLDRKIELNNKINADLEEMAQAIFKNWFVDFEPFKDGKFVDSELGMIPEGWKVGRLDEIADVVGGSTPSKAKPEYYTQKGIAWLTPKDLSNHPAVYTSRGEIDITEEGYNSTSTKLMPKGTILFTSRAPIGYISIAQNDICTNQGFKSLVPKKAGTCFLYCFLKYVTPEIENKSTGSTFKEASGALMKSLQVIMPDQKVFEEFEEIVSPLFARIESLEKESSRLSLLRDTLLPRLMSGEIEVPE